VSAIRLRCLIESKLRRTAFAARVSPETRRTERQHVDQASTLNDHVGTLNCHEARWV